MSWPVLDRFDALVVILFISLFLLNITISMFLLKVLLMCFRRIKT